MSVIDFKNKSKKFLQTNTGANVPPPVGISAIGIDLGTTNSVVSIYRRNEVHPVTLDYEGTHLIPSVIFYDDEFNLDIVGVKAKEKIKNTPNEVVKSTKRSMGKNTHKFYSNRRSYHAEQAAELILKYISEHPVLIEEKLKFGFVWAVITVPAHFDDAARMATISAASKVGIQVLRIINEPTAAALAYSMIDDVSTKNFDSTEFLAVFDLGGGTFDVSVVERHELTFNVLSSEGDIQLGGDNLDESLAEFLLTKIQPAFVGRRAHKNSDLYRRVLEIAENVKKELQTEASVQIKYQNIDGKDSYLETEVTREEFENLAFPILEKTIYLTESAIHATKRSLRNISKILLVGGSTRLNLIRKMLSDYFPCQIDARLEPDLAVSWGASLQAAIILGINVDTILVDVCCHTLGVGVIESSDEVQDNFKKAVKKFGYNYPITEAELQRKLGARIEDFNRELQGLLKVAPILYRNSSLPSRKSEFFNTVYSNQSAVNVIVVQGEGSTVGENRLIGSFLFQLEQPCPKGTRCEIQLTYDVNGMVQVFAKQLGTQNEVKAHFDSRTGEVKGWSPLFLNGLDLPHLTHDHVPINEQEAASIDDACLTENNLNNVVSLGFLKTKNEKISEEEGAVVNALLLRARRYLNLTDASSQEYMTILSLTKTYSDLLIKARYGANNDVEIEDIEEKILSALEGK